MNSKLVKCIRPLCKNTNLATQVACQECLRSLPKVIQDKLRNSEPIVWTAGVKAAIAYWENPPKSRS